jgi:hypothetical protein
MTTERFNEIVGTISSACNNQNRQSVMDAVIELIKHGYHMGKGKQDIYWDIAALEDARVRV